MYFYGPVDRTSVCTFCRELKTLECKMIQMKHDYTLKECPTIYIYIQSEGGDAFAGLCAMDSIKGCRVPTVTIVDGYVASAASFMLLGGDEKVIKPHSQTMIHEIKTEFWGKYRTQR